jgi:hypothetical protein
VVVHACTVVFSHTHTHTRALHSDVVSEWLASGNKSGVDGVSSSGGGASGDDVRALSGAGDAGGLLGIALMRDLLRGNGSGSADVGSWSLLARVARVIEAGARHLLRVREATARGLTNSRSNSTVRSPLCVGLLYIVDTMHRCLERANEKRASGAGNVGGRRDYAA